MLIDNLRHPFLVALKYSFQTVDKLYFVLDYVNGFGGYEFRNRVKSNLKPELHIVKTHWFYASIASVSPIGKEIKMYIYFMPIITAVWLFFSSIESGFMLQ